MAQVRKENGLKWHSNLLLQLFLQMAGGKSVVPDNLLLFIWHFQQVLFSSQIAYLFKGV